MKYNVRVKTGVKGAERVEVLADASLVLWTRAKAHDGEANKAIVSLLAEHFGVAKSCVEIVAGAKSKNKIVSVIKK